MFGVCAGDPYPSEVVDLARGVPQGSDEGTGRSRLEAFQQHTQVRYLVELCLALELRKEELLLRVLFPQDVL